MDPAGGEPASLSSVGNTRREIGDLDVAVGAGRLCRISGRGFLERIGHSELARKLGRFWPRRVLIDVIKPIPPSEEFLAQFAAEAVGR